MEWGLGTHYRGRNGVTNSLCRHERLHCTLAKGDGMEIAGQICKQDTVGKSLLAKPSMNSVGRCQKTQIRGLATHTKMKPVDNEMCTKKREEERAYNSRKPVSFFVCVLGGRVTSSFVQKLTQTTFHWYSGIFSMIFFFFSWSFAVTIFLSLWSLISFASHVMHVKKTLLFYFIFSHRPYVDSFLT